MNANRKTAAIVGALFLIALVTDLVGGELLERIIHAPDYLTNIHPNRIQVIMGMLLELIAAATVVGIPVMLFPILKKHSERIALGYIGFRIVEAVIIAVYVFSVPSLLALSQEYVKAAAPDVSYFQTIGTSLMAESYWVYPMVTVFFGLGALFFYYLLYKSKLIPRFIPVWGLIGVVLLLTGALIGMFGRSEGYSVIPEPGIIVYAAPIALNEVFLAIWLIAKGFNSSAIASESA
jgi:hypothetical protein